MTLTKKKPKSEAVTFPLSVCETVDTKEDLEDWQVLKEKLCME